MISAKNKMRQPGSTMLVIEEWKSKETIVGTP